MALDVADETDVPTITRTILKTVTRGTFWCSTEPNSRSENAHEVVSVIRNQLKDVSSQTCGLVLEIIGNALAINPLTGFTFVTELTNMLKLKPFLHKLNHAVT
jgi:hypothetical protein